MPNPVEARNNKELCPIIGIIENYAQSWQSQE
jgi:hypothetical protein